MVSGVGGFDARAPVLGVVGGALALLAMIGWAITAVATGFEGGAPFLFGHPLPLFLARLAAPAALVAFGALALAVEVAWRKGRIELETRFAHAATVLLGAVFFCWAWYWHLLPWT